MLQNVAMTSHLGKKSGLIPAASVTAATPAPGKGTGHTPSPYSGGHIAQNPNHEPPPPFLFVDSLKPIEIVVSFTALSKWLDPPQPIIKERDKEKESNSVFTGVRDDHHLLYTRSVVLEHTSLLQFCMKLLPGSFPPKIVFRNVQSLEFKRAEIKPFREERVKNTMLRTVLTIVTAHTFCAFLDTRVSYR